MKPPTLGGPSGADLAPQHRLPRKGLLPASAMAFGAGGANRSIVNDACMLFTVLWALGRLDVERPIEACRRLVLV